MSQHGALHVRRRRLLLALLLLGGLALLGRGFQLQVLQAAQWQGRAERQHREQIVLPAERGTIFDRNGIPLATTREMIRVATAPREIEDRDVVARALRETLGLSPAVVRRALNRGRRWVVLPGRYEPTVRAGLEDLTGVYLERVLERFLPHGGVAREVLGRVSPDGRALGGVELDADSLLRGEDGYAVVRRDARGDPIPGALVPVKEPRAGHSIFLTLDLGLQEIAEEALRTTLREHDAEAGDLIFADPRTGELLAAASVRRSGRRHWRGVTDPYEPGSTIKPFVMAALLERGRVSLEDSVFAEDGYYRLGRREIRDVHGRGWLTAGEVLRYSSNIGMVKLAERLEPAEQYVALRSFGFGTPTGVRYPSESGGRLSRPEGWSGYTQASLAMGYEVSVTPLQMTMAYGALANGGRLMEPELIREVRSPEGRRVWESRPQVIRRAVSDTTARRIAAALADVVREGTGQEAGLGEFHVAGKTGTARMFENGGYRRDAFTASFAGFFPARDPQLVFLVKLDRGSEYGGSVAAPVTRATLAAALAARATPLDRRAMAAAAPDPAPVRGAGVSAAWLPPAPGPFVFRTDAGPPERPAVAEDLRVPDVRGRSARDAVTRLHASGFRTRVAGVGTVQGMTPAAGTAAARGSLVVLTLGWSR
ncbi:MAG: PASTA domain-containing protein [Gemmatimonadetes bacterium]|nr:PASTA domain-containing protein [Gemmatimonadota bacterium]NIQ58168.1 PASTA domain-containing protein [Gemmatimonadota bacterium]NIU78374.1 PASTA domain-containing protein [Gammaproteobacteria bacterium]NIX47306.1 PASTA domain-containing protein [Gemmatimonadota bacterium]NIY11679.1 PASTA domain-containing protein [Gemmatimonadota bacterium]